MMLNNWLQAAHDYEVDASRLRFVAEACQVDYETALEAARTLARTSGLTFHDACQHNITEIASERDPVSDISKLGRRSSDISKLGRRKLVEYWSGREL